MTYLNLYSQVSNMPRTEEQTREEIAQVLKELSQDEQRLLSRVINAERAKIHMGRPHGIIDDLRKAVDEVIKG
jgi:hypothetical protein